jgi:hypothetical protein
MRIAVCVAASLVIAVSAAQAGPPRIKTAPFDPYLSYSPASASAASDSLVIESNGHVGAVCVVFTWISTAPTPGAPQRAPDYGLFSADGSSRLSVDGAPAGAYETLSGVFPPGTKPKDSIQLDFLAEIFPTTLPPMGSYSVTFRAALYAKAYPPSGPVAASAYFTVTISVGRVYALSVAQSGGPFSQLSTTGVLAFGDLREGAARGADILVRANTLYDLSLLSSHSGAFANATDGTLLGYSLTSNGYAVDLSRGAALLAAGAAGSNYWDPSRYALVATILSFGAMPTEGSYSDTITIVLSAR